MSNKFVSSNIKWLGMAGFFLDDKPSVYIDPYQLAFPSIGDMVLVTHDHPEHCDPNEIKWLRKGSTVIVCPESCGSKFIGDIRVVKPGDVITVKGAKIEVLPAYTTNPRHPAEAGGVGYIITMSDGTRVYHMGDTGLTSTMKEGIADVVLVPISGENTMNAEQAAEAVNLMKPKVAVPMHWLVNKEGKAEAERFVKLCNVNAEIIKVTR